jgi:hypothetical protein
LLRGRTILTLEPDKAVARGAIRGNVGDNMPKDIARLTSRVMREEGALNVMIFRLRLLTAAKGLALTSVTLSSEELLDIVYQRDSVFTSQPNPLIQARLRQNVAQTDYPQHRESSY